MQEALRTRLKADPTIAGLVGPRVDWGLRPQGKPLPALALTLVPTPRDYTMGGADATQHYRVQVDCWAEDYRGAHELRDAVIAELEPASGEFLGGFVTRNFDAPERTDSGIINRAVLEFKLFHISA
jgi:hypothetical protein